MIGKFALQRLYEDRCAGTDGARLGPGRFVQSLREMLGLPKERFGYHSDIKSNGKPHLKDAQIKPAEFSLRGLFEAMCGDRALARLDPNAGQAVLREDAGPGNDPTAFLNISAFNAAVSGLIEVQILEKYDDPDYIGDKIIQVKPTRLNGQKLIGVARMADGAKKRLPGMPHQPAGLNEIYVETPETEEWGLKCDVTQEAVFFDLTGQVLDRAGDVGEMIGYRREQRIIDSFIGASGATYKYKGTTYNTFYASGGGGPYVNDQVNALSDYTSLDKSLGLFNLLTDPETGLSISVVPKLIVATPFQEAKFQHVLRSVQVGLVDNQANAATYRAFAPLPERVASRFQEPLYSIYLYNRMIASATDPDYPGLGYATGTTGKAALTFFVGDPQRGHLYMENWPLRVRQASSTEYTMMDRGIIASYFADERGVPTWKDPRFNQRNTPS